MRRARWLAVAGLLALVLGCATTVHTVPPEQVATTDGYLALRLHERKRPLQLSPSFKAIFQNSETGARYAHRMSLSNEIHLVQLPPGEYQFLRVEAWHVVAAIEFFPIPGRIIVYPTGAAEHPFRVDERTITYLGDFVVTRRSTLFTDHVQFSTSFDFTRALEELRQSEGYLQGMEFRAADAWIRQ